MKSLSQEKLVTASVTAAKRPQKHTQADKLANSQNQLQTIH